MKLTSGHKKKRLVNKKMIKEKLIKKAYHHMIWLRKQQKKFMSQISNFEELECGKPLKIN